MDAFLLLTAAIVIAMIVGAAVLPNIRASGPKRRREPRDPASAPDQPPYQPRLFLTRAEKAFFRVLVAALGDEGVVFAQTPIASIIRVSPGATGRQGWHNKIDRKTVDFLVCDPVNLDPIAAIELDDASHDRAQRVERDTFVDGAFEAAGVPLIRIPAARAYAPNDLRDLVLGARRNTPGAMAPTGAERTPRERNG